MRTSTSMDINAMVANPDGSTYQDLLTTYTDCLL